MVRLRASSFTAAAGLAPRAPGLMDGLAWPVLVLAELVLAGLEGLGLVFADPPAGSVSEAGYGGTTEVVSAGDPES